MKMLVPLLLCSLLMTACGGQTSSGGAPDFKTFQAKAPGMTKEELKAAFGNPYNVSEHNMGVEWQYKLVNHPDTGGGARCTAYFDKSISLEKVSKVILCFSTNS